jgi:hypothetical protein
MNGLMTESSFWEPCSKERFFEVCAEFGVNRTFASDLWHFRPAEHQHDTESEVRGNLALMVKMDTTWAERMNAAALAIVRHEFRPISETSKHLAGQLCDECIEPRMHAGHNTEPLTFKDLAPAPRAQLHEGTEN